MKMANANENNADEYDFVESMRRRFQYSHRRFRLMLEMFGEIELIEKSYKHYENVLLEILQQSKVSATAALEIKHLMGRFGKLLTDTFLPLNRRYFDNLNNTVTDKDVDADMELCARNLQSFLTILGQSIERLLDSCMTVLYFFMSFICL
jgi:hypothetical protein